MNEREEKDTTALTLTGFREESLANAKVSARQPWYIWRNSLNRLPLRIAQLYQRGLYIVEKYTVSQQKGTPTLSIVTLRRINGFWRFLVQIFLTQLAIKWLFKFPPHPTSASTLPGEIRTLLQVRYYILYKAVLSLY